MKKTWTRRIAWISLFFFLSSDAGGPVSAWAQLVPSEIFQESHSSVNFSHPLPAIPELLGSVSEKHAGDGPLLVHLQTAHGNYQAQRQIFLLLRFLKNTYGIDTVFEEGTGTDLKSRILRLFPENMSLTHALADRMVRRGLVKGADLFLIAEPTARGFGIEETSLYRKNREVFKDVLRQSARSRSFLQELHQSLERLISPYMNRILRQFLMQREAQERGHLPLSSWVHKLKDEALRLKIADLDGPEQQLDWPMLVRLFKLESLEKRIDRGALPAEREKFLLQAEPYLSRHSEILRGLHALLNLNPASQDPGSEASRLVESAAALLPRDFPYAQFPNLNRQLGFFMLQSEMESGLLAREVERLEGAVREALCENDTERTISGLVTRRALLEKLLALELVPSEYEKIIAAPADYRPSALIEQFREADHEGRLREMTFSHASDLDLLFDRALEFYALAKERDRVMAEKLRSLMQTKGIRRAAVITGGFHAAPFADYFKAQGFRYLQVSPRLDEIHETKDRQTYLRMLFQNESPAARATLETSSPLLLPGEIAEHGSDPAFELAEELGAVADYNKTARVPVRPEDLAATEHHRAFGYRIPAVLNEAAILQLAKSELRAEEIPVPVEVSASRVVARYASDKKADGSVWSIFFPGSLGGVSDDWVLLSHGDGNTANLRLLHIREDRNHPEIQYRFEADPVFHKSEPVFEEPVFPAFGAATTPTRQEFMVFNGYYGYYQGFRFEFKPKPQGLMVSKFKEFNRQDQIGHEALGLTYNPSARNYLGIFKDHEEDRIDARIFRAGYTLSSSASASALRGLNEPAPPVYDPVHEWMTVIDLDEDGEYVMRAYRWHPHPLAGQMERGSYREAGKVYLPIIKNHDFYYTANIFRMTVALQGTRLVYLVSDPNNRALYVFEPQVLPDTSSGLQLSGLKLLHIIDLKEVLNVTRAEVYKNDYTMPVWAQPRSGRLVVGDPKERQVLLLPSLDELVGSDVYRTFVGFVTGLARLDLRAMTPKKRTFFHSPVTFWNVPGAEGSLELHVVERTGAAHYQKIITAGDLQHGEIPAAEGWKPVPASSAIPEKEGWTETLGHAHPDPRFAEAGPWKVRASREWNAAATGKIQVSWTTADGAALTQDFKIEGYHPYEKQDVWAAVSAQGQAAILHVYPNSEYPTLWTGRLRENKGRIELVSDRPDGRWLQLSQQEKPHGLFYDAAGRLWTYAQNADNERLVETQRIAEKEITQGVSSVPPVPSPDSGAHSELRAVPESGELDQEDLFGADEIAEMQRRLSLLKGGWAHWDVPAKEMLLEPSFLLMLLGIKPGYFKSTSEESSPLKFFGAVTDAFDEHMMLAVPVRDRLNPIAVSIPQAAKAFSLHADLLRAQGIDLDERYRAAFEAFAKEPFRYDPQYLVRYIWELFAQAVKSDNKLDAFMGILSGYPAEDIREYLKAGGRKLARQNALQGRMNYQGTEFRNVFFWARMQGSPEALRQKARYRAALYYAYSQLRGLDGFREIASSISLPEMVHTAPIPASLARTELRAEPAAIAQDIRARGAKVFQWNAREEGKRFDEITDELLRRRVLGKKKFNVIWMTGIWKTGKFTEAFNKMWDPNRVGSAYSIDDYVINPALGDEQSFEAFVERANRLGIKVIADFVPNHMAADSSWILEDPRYFVQSTREEDEATENLDDYFSKGQAGFRQKLYFMAEGGDGRRHKISHGRDVTGPWIDTAQLDLSYPPLRKKLLETMRRVLRLTHGGGIRIDAADRTTREAFLKMFGIDMGTEFWPEAIASLKAEFPKSLFISETFWGDQKKFQDFGSDLTYDVDFYHQTVDTTPPSAAEITDHLVKPGFDGRRALRFLENHDLPNGKRVSAVLEKERHKAAAALLLAAAPGAVLIYDGQAKGRSREKPSAIMLTRKKRQETYERDLEQFYDRLLQITDSPIFRFGRVQRILKRGSEGAFVAVRRSWKGRDALVVVNYGSASAAFQYAPLSAFWRVKEGQEASAVWRDTGGETISFASPLSFELNPWESRILFLDRGRSELRTGALTREVMLEAIKAGGLSEENLGSDDKGFYVTVERSRHEKVDQLHAVVRALEPYQDRYTMQVKPMVDYGDHQLQILPKTKAAAKRTGRRDRYGRRELRVEPPVSLDPYNAALKDFFAARFPGRRDLRGLDLGSGTPPHFMQRLAVEAHDFLSAAYALDYANGRSRLLEVSIPREAGETLPEAREMITAGGLFEEGLNEIIRDPRHFHRYDFVTANAPQGDVNAYLREARELLAPGGLLLMRFHRLNSRLADVLRQHHQAWGWDLEEFPQGLRGYPDSRDNSSYDSLFALRSRSELRTSSIYIPLRTMVQLGVRRESTKEGPAPDFLYQKINRSDFSMLASLPENREAVYIPQVPFSISKARPETSAGDYLLVYKRENHQYHVISVQDPEGKTLDAAAFLDFIRGEAGAIRKESSGSYRYYAPTISDWGTIMEAGGLVGSMAGQKYSLSAEALQGRAFAHEPVTERKESNTQAGVLYRVAVPVSTDNTPEEKRSFYAIAEVWNEHEKAWQSFENYTAYRRKRGALPEDINIPEYLAHRALAATDRMGRIPGYRESLDALIGGREITGIALLPGGGFGDASEWWMNTTLKRDQNGKIIDFDMKKYLEPARLRMSPYHEGLDIFVARNEYGDFLYIPPGTGVRPVRKGKVVAVTDDVMGQTVVVEHPDLKNEFGDVSYSLYSHVTSKVKAGDEVGEETVIAAIADPGKEWTGAPPHLHFSMMWIPRDYEKVSGRPVNWTEYHKAFMPYNPYFMPFYLADVLERADLQDLPVPEGVRFLPRPENAARFTAESLLALLRLLYARISRESHEHRRPSGLWIPGLKPQGPELKILEHLLTALQLLGPDAAIARPMISEMNDLIHGISGPQDELTGQLRRTLAAMDEPRKEMLSENVLDHLVQAANLSEDPFMKGLLIETIGEWGPKAAQLLPWLQYQMGYYQGLASRGWDQAQIASFYPLMAVVRTVGRIGPEARHAQPLLTAFKKSLADDGVFEHLAPPLRQQVEQALAAMDGAPFEPRMESVIAREVSQAMALLSIMVYLYEQHPESAAPYRFYLEQGLGRILEYGPQAVKAGPLLAVLGTRAHEAGEDQDAAFIEYVMLVIGYYLGQIPQKSIARFRLPHIEGWVQIFQSLKTDDEDKYRVTVRVDSWKVEGSKQSAGVEDNLRVPREGWDPEAFALKVRDYLEKNLKLNAQGFISIDDFYHGPLRQIPTLAGLPATTDGDLTGNVQVTDPWRPAEGKRKSELRAEGVQAGASRRLQWLEDARANDLAAQVFKALAPEDTEGLKERGPYTIDSHTYRHEQSEEVSVADFRTAVVERIGPLVFVVLSTADWEVAADINTKLAALYKQYPSNIFITTRPDHSRYVELGAYTSKMVVALLERQKDFKGAVVTDFGSGNGLLSRIALKALEAGRVLMLDHSPYELNVARKFLIAEGFTEGTPVSGDFFAGNVDLERQQGKVMLNQIRDLTDIGILNMGPWIQYGNANWQVAQEVAGWPRVRLFLNGGYGYGFSGHEEALREVSGMLREKGFETRIPDRELFGPRSSATLIIAERKTGEPDFFGAGNDYAEGGDFDFPEPDIVRVPKGELRSSLLEPLLFAAIAAAAGGSYFIFRRQRAAENLTLPEVSEITDLLQTRPYVQTKMRDLSRDETGVLFDGLGKHVAYADLRRILAIGVTPREVEALLKRSPAAELDIVDVQQKPLENLRDYFRGKPSAVRVKFYRADASSLDSGIFSDGSYDLIYAFGIDHDAFEKEEDARRVLSGMVQEEMRLLAPGGVVFHLLKDEADYRKEALASGRLTRIPGTLGLYRRPFEDQGSTPRTELRVGEDTAEKRYFIGRSKVRLREGYYLRVPQYSIYREGPTEKQTRDLPAGDTRARAMVDAALQYLWEHAMVGTPTVNTALVHRVLALEESTTLIAKDLGTYFFFANEKRGFGDPSRLSLRQRAIYLSKKFLENLDPASVQHQALVALYLNRAQFVIDLFHKLYDEGYTQDAIHARIREAVKDSDFMDKALLLGGIPESDLDAFLAPLIHADEVQRAEEQKTITSRAKAVIAQANALEKIHDEIAQKGPVVSTAGLPAREEYNRIAHDLEEIGMLFQSIGQRSKALVFYRRAQRMYRHIREVDPGGLLPFRVQEEIVDLLLRGGMLDEFLQEFKNLLTGSSMPEPLIQIEPEILLSQLNGYRLSWLPLWIKDAFPKLLYTLQVYGSIYSGQEERKQVLTVIEEVGKIVDAYWSERARSLTMQPGSFDKRWQDAELLSKGIALVPFWNTWKDLRFRWGRTAADHADQVVVEAFSGSSERKEERRVGDFRFTAAGGEARADLTSLSLSADTVRDFSGIEEALVIFALRLSKANGVANFEITGPKERGVFLTALGFENPAEGLWRYENLQSKTIQQLPAVRLIQNFYTGNEQKAVLPPVLDASGEEPKGLDKGGAAHSELRTQAAGAPEDLFQQYDQKIDRPGEAMAEADWQILETQFSINQLARLGTRIFAAMAGGGAVLGKQELEARQQRIMGIIRQRNLKQPPPASGKPGLILPGDAGPRTELRVKVEPAGELDLPVLLKELNKKWDGGVRSFDQEIAILHKSLPLEAEKIILSANLAPLVAYSPQHEMLSLIVYAMLEWEAAEIEQLEKSGSDPVQLENTRRILSEELESLNGLIDRVNREHPDRFALSVPQLILQSLSGYVTDDKAVQKLTDYSARLHYLPRYQYLTVALNLYFTGAHLADHMVAFDWSDIESLLPQIRFAAGVLQGDQGMAELSEAEREQALWAIKLGLFKFLLAVEPLLLDDKIWRERLAEGRYLNTNAGDIEKLRNHPAGLELMKMVRQMAPVFIPQIAGVLEEAPEAVAFAASLHWFFYAKFAEAYLAPWKRRDGTPVSFSEALLSRDFDSQREFLDTVPLLKEYQGDQSRADYWGDLRESEGYIDSQLERAESFLQALAEASGLAWQESGFNPGGISRPEMRAVLTALLAGAAVGAGLFFAADAAGIKNGNLRGLLASLAAAPVVYAVWRLSEPFFFASRVRSALKNAVILDKGSYSFALTHEKKLPGQVMLLRRGVISIHRDQRKAVSLPQNTREAEEAIYRRLHPLGMVADTRYVGEVSYKDVAVTGEDKEALNRFLREKQRGETGDVFVQRLGVPLNKFINSYHPGSTEAIQKALAAFTRRLWQQGFIDLDLRLENYLVPLDHGKPRRDEAGNWVVQIHDLGSVQPLPADREGLQSFFLQGTSFDGYQKGMFFLRNLSKNQGVARQLFPGADFSEGFRMIEEARAERHQGFDAASAKSRYLGQLQKRENQQLLAFYASQWSEAIFRASAAGQRSELRMAKIPVSRDQLVAHPAWEQLYDAAPWMDTAHFMERLLWNQRDLLEAAAQYAGYTTLLGFLESLPVVYSRLQPLDRIARFSEYLWSHLPDWMKHHEVDYPSVLDASDMRFSYFFRYPEQYAWFYNRLLRQLAGAREKRTTRPVQIDLVGPGYFQEPLTLLALIKTAYEKLGMTVEQVPFELRVFGKNEAPIFEMFRQGTLVFREEEIRNNIREAFSDLETEEAGFAADILRDRDLFANNLSTLLKPATLPGTQPVVVTPALDFPLAQEWFDRMTLHEDFVKEETNADAAFIFMNSVFYYAGQTVRENLARTAYERLEDSGFLFSMLSSSATEPVSKNFTPEPSLLALGGSVHVRDERSPFQKVGAFIKARPELRSNGSARRAGTLDTLTFLRSLNEAWASGARDVEPYLRQIRESMEGPVTLLIQDNKRSYPEMPDYQELIHLTAQYILEYETSQIEAVVKNLPGGISYPDTRTLEQLRRGQKETLKEFEKFITQVHQTYADRYGLSLAQAFTESLSGNYVQDAVVNKYIELQGRLIYLPGYGWDVVALQLFLNGIYLSHNLVKADISHIFPLVPQIRTILRVLEQPETITDFQVPRDTGKTAWALKVGLLKFLWSLEPLLVSDEVLERRMSGNYYSNTTAEDVIWLRQVAYVRDLRKIVQEAFPVIKTWNEEIRLKDPDMAALYYELNWYFYHDYAEHHLPAWRTPEGGVVSLREALLDPDAEPYRRMLDKLPVGLKGSNGESRMVLWEERRYDARYVRQRQAVIYQFIQNLEESYSQRSELRESGNALPVFAETRTLAARRVLEVFRELIMSREEIKRMGIREAAAFLSGLLGRPVYAREAGLIAEKAAPVFKDAPQGRLVRVRNFDQTLLPAAVAVSDKLRPGSLWLDRKWFGAFLSQPRAFYLLLEAVSELEKPAGGKPLLVVSGSDSLYQEMEKTLTRRSSLHWSERLKARQQLLPRLHALVRVVPETQTEREAFNALSVSEELAAATLLSTAASREGLEGEAHFVLSPDSVRSADLEAAALMVPALLLAASLIRNLRDPAEQVRILNRILPPGFQRQNQVYAVQLAAFAEYLQAQKVIEWMA